MVARPPKLHLQLDTVALVCVCVYNVLTNDWMPLTYVSLSLNALCDTVSQCLCLLAIATLLVAAKYIVHLA